MSDFYKKAGAVTICVLVVLTALKLLVIDEISKLHSVEAKAAGAYVPETGGGGQEAKKPDFLKTNRATIAWEDAPKNIDKYVDTEGKIVSAYNSGKICFLNFSKDYKNTLTLVIFAGDFRRFHDNPDKYYLGKKIGVQGRIKDYKGKVEIVLRSSDQVRVLDK
jgi:hypothetical protein